MLTSSPLRPLFHRWPACHLSIDGMKEVDAIDHEDDDLKLAPDFFLPEKVGKEYRVACHWWCPLQSNSHTFSKIKHFNPKSSEASFPNIPSLFSKLHVLHRKGPTLSTSTRAPVFHWFDRRMNRLSFGPHLHGQVRRQSAINEGQRCGQAAAHRYPTKEGHPEKLGSQHAENEIKMSENGEYKNSSTPVACDTTNQNTRYWKPSPTGDNPESFQDVNKYAEKTLKFTQKCWPFKKTKVDSGNVLRSLAMAEAMAEPDISPTLVSVASGSIHKRKSPFRKLKNWREPLTHRSSDECSLKMWRFPKMFWQS